MARKMALTGAKLLLGKAGLERLPDPISDIGGTYWLVAINFPKGKRVYNWFLSKTTDLMASVRLEFTSVDGDKFHSDAYEVNEGWGRKSDTFPIQPKSTVKLAVVRRAPDLRLYLLSGSFAKDPLYKTYDVQLIINLESQHEQLVLPNLRVPSFIRDGELKTKNE
jgi:hypothetical protein